METEKSRKRRRYSRELKKQIIGECEAPGASVAKVAMSHCINANIVHGWRKLAREANLPMLPAPQFVPVAVTPVQTTSAQERQVGLGLRRGPLVIELSWPITDTAGLGHWLRELLR